MLLNEQNNRLQIQQLAVQSGQEQISAELSSPVISVLWELLSRPAADPRSSQLPCSEWGCASRTWMEEERMQQHLVEKAQEPPSVPPWMSNLPPSLCCAAPSWQKG